jgi:hypothetical protein
VDFIRWSWRCQSFKRWTAGSVAFLCVFRGWEAMIH